MIFKALAQNIIQDMQKDNFVIIHPSSPISPTFLMIFTSISCYFYDTPTPKKNTNIVIVIVPEKIVAVGPETSSFPCINVHRVNFSWRLNQPI